MCNIYITNRPPMCAYNCVQTLHSKSIVFYIIINISSWVSVSSRACVNVLFELQFCTSWTFQVDKKTLQLASCNNSTLSILSTSSASPDRACLYDKQQEEKENTGICVKQRQNSCENKLFDKLTQTVENFQKHAHQHIRRLHIYLLRATPNWCGKGAIKGLGWLAGTRPN